MKINEDVLKHAQLIITMNRAFKKVAEWADRINSTIFVFPIDSEADKGKFDIMAILAFYKMQGLCSKTFPLVATDKKKTSMYCP